MITAGFTGSRDITDDEALKIQEELRKINASAYVTGACIGVDQLIAEFVHVAWPNRKNVIIVPANRSRVNMKFVDYMSRQENTEIIYMPPGTSYAHRNQAIVDRSDVLVGFPAYRESHVASQRSGTWQTIRKAKLAQKSVVVKILRA